MLMNNFVFSYSLTVIVHVLMLQVFSFEPLNHVKTQLATHAKMAVRASQSFQEALCAHAQTGTKVQTAPSRCAVKTSALSASSA